jgi:hypothetical protein
MNGGGSQTAARSRRLAERNASPVIQAGIDRPDRKKSALVFMYFFSTKPIPRTNVK